jgi:hypothetical protein
MVRKALVLAVVLISGTARADDNIIVIGAGQKTCGSFISAVGDAPPGQFAMVNTRHGEFDSELRNYQSWLMGFVTGVNLERAAHEASQIANVDIAAIDLWMRNWCSTHPTRTVLKAL